MKLPFNELFLQFVWQYQYFDRRDLQTANGETIEVLNQGQRNQDEGPDFLNSKIRIGDMLWIGSVEIHLETQGWAHHHHQSHLAYNNVILHVVFESRGEQIALRNDGSKIPVLVLKGSISADLIAKGNELFENIATIPCSNFLPEIDQILFDSTLARSITHRLERKSDIVLEMLKRNRNDWEETTYQLIASHFGMKVNSESLLLLAEAVPLRLLLKTSENLLATEALLFGQAGFLNFDLDDHYHQQLKKEYSYLKHKHGLKNELNVGAWKHLRLRPFNFPEIRIAELAALYHKNGFLHAELIGQQDFKNIKSMFKADISPYWKTHFGFGKLAGAEIKGIGASAIDNLIINVVVNLLVAQGRYKNDTSYVETAYNMLDCIEAENNKIVRLWGKFGKKPANASDSQAMIELFNTFCSAKACLSCQIGTTILRK